MNSFNVESIVVAFCCLQAMECDLIKLNYKYHLAASDEVAHFFVIFVLNMGKKPNVDNILVDMYLCDFVGFNGVKCDATNINKSIFGRNTFVLYLEHTLMNIFLR